MKLQSRILLDLSRRLPRGYARLLQFAARRDPALQDFQLQMAEFPTPLRADLRETVFIGLFRSLRIPQQAGLDTLFRQIVLPGDTVFDVGANVGYTTAFFAHLTGAAGLVVALEPSPRTFSYLQRSFGGLPNVELLNIGASHEEGELTFYVPAMLDRASFVPMEGAQAVLVKTQTLDSLCERYGAPRFLKIDVEGYEPSVLRGASALLSDVNAPVVAFEAWSREDLEMAQSVFEAARPGRMRYWRVNADGSLGDLADPQETCDYLAVPDNALPRFDDVKQ
ncbi:FkbM family methyltransferase [Amorphus sp. MBR-141]